MKAAQINQYGDSSAIQINEVEKPVPAEGQVLVEVYASSLNPVDTAVRSGALQQAMPLQFPITLGGDIAGVVAEVADGVTGVAVGDRVYGQSLVVTGNSGALAEYATTVPAQIAHMPAQLDFNQAASLPLTGSSALQALMQHLDLKPGQTIFIHGGAGNIGSLAIQVAKDMGARVTTTATGDGLALVQQLGADEVIDYKAEDFSTRLRDYDAALDTVGGQDFSKMLTILKPGGIAVTLAGQVDQALADRIGVTAIAQFTQVTTGSLDVLSELIEKGTVKPWVGKIYPLEQVKDAFDARESDAVHGKVVIQIKAA